jgi:2,4-diaminopentanoate dehydrogenase
MSYRVIQCGTGMAGGEALRVIIDCPDLELVGLLVARAENAGRDAGDLVGKPAIGIKATNAIDDIVAIDADIVCYMLVVPNLGDICRLLASGKNVVTTAGLIFPAWRALDTRQKLAAACAEGGSSFYVTGINPGWVDEVLPLVMSSLCRDIERIDIREYADCAQYPSPGLTFDVMGFGKTPEEIAAGAVPDMTVMTDFFSQAVAALGHGLGLELDDIAVTREFALAPHDFTIEAGPVKAGTIAGQRWCWSGSAAGVFKIVQETYWVIAFDLGNGWPKAGEFQNDTQWQVTIEGSPSLRCVFEPRVSFKDADAEGPNPSGLSTAMAAVNSLTAVCDAPAGLLTSIDLKLPRWRGAS